MKTPTTPVLRRLIPWILGGTLVVLAVLAITRIVWLREQVYNQAQQRLEERLEERVQTWEKGFLGTLRLIRERRSGRGKGLVTAT